MPVVLTREQASLWCDCRNISFDDCRPFLEPYQSLAWFVCCIIHHLTPSPMSSNVEYRYPVSGLVSNMKNKDASCIVPLSTTGNVPRITKFFPRSTKAACITGTSSDESSIRGRRSDMCYKCKFFGHWARDCSFKSHTKVASDNATHNVIMPTFTTTPPTMTSSVSINSPPSLRPTLSASTHDWLASPLPLADNRKRKQPSTPNDNTCTNTNAPLIIHVAAFTPTPTIIPLTTSSTTLSTPDRVASRRGYGKNLSPQLSLPFASPAKRSLLGTFNALPSPIPSPLVSSSTSSNETNKRARLPVASLVDVLNGERLLP
jgi:hypothetical protein